MIERIYATLQLEMLDLEEFIEKYENSDKHVSIKTQEVVIRYTLNGQDKFLILDYPDILRLIKSKAEGLRRELVGHGVVKEKRND